MLSAGRGFYRRLTRGLCGGLTRRYSCGLSRGLTRGSTRRISSGAASRLSRGLCCRLARGLYRRLACGLCGRLTRRYSCGLSRGPSRGLTLWADPWAGSSCLVLCLQGLASGPTCGQARGLTCSSACGNCAAVGCPDGLASLRAADPWMPSTPPAPLPASPPQRLLLSVLSAVSGCARALSARPQVGLLLAVPWPAAQPVTTARLTICACSRGL